MLKSLHIENFTVFRDATFAFSTGINVFLGANGTGKTHVLKLLYCIESYFARDASNGLSHVELENKRQLMADKKLVEVFGAEGSQVVRLVSRLQPGLAAMVEAEFEDAKFYSCFGDRNAFNNGVIDGRDTAYSSRGVFLPAREVLSIFPGFISTYLDRESPFDETYYDLCVALDRLLLRGPRGEEAAILKKPLADAIRSIVQREGQRFYLTSEADGKVEVPLAAEGTRKIAGLMHLIANGSITKNSILFWDEPEANLNPKLIKVVADFLLTLASQGMQIFIATHDYLLTNELSLQAEYRTKAFQDAPTRFFAFNRGPDNGVSVQSGSMLSELDRNPIMDEFEALYDRERNLFMGEPRQK